MFTVSAHVDALVLVQSGEMISSNYTSFGVAMNSGGAASAGCSREEHVPFLLRRIGFGTLLASRKETLYAWLSVLGWLIFDNFI